MKLVKRMLPAGLSLLLAAAGPAAVYAASPEFSKTEEEWASLRDNVLEYEEIDDLIHEYNTTVAANLVEYERTRRKSVDDVTEDYWEAADQFGNAIFYAANEMDAAAARVSQRQAENAAADNVDDGEIDRLTYAKAEAGLVKQAQQYMNTYHQLLLKKQLEEYHVAYQEELLNSATARQGVGTATSVDILNAQQALYDAQAEIINLTAQIEDARQKLAIMTGWKLDGNPDIQALPVLDPARVDSINPDADQDTAQQNDYSLLIEKRRLEHSDYPDTRELYETNVRQLEESIRSAVSLGYQNVLQARTAYEQAGLAMTVASNDYTAGLRKWEVGMLSRVEFDNLQYQLYLAQTNYQIKGMEFFQIQENYDWLLAGLASA